jgi:hypothetical protein
MITLGKDTPMATIRLLEGQTIVYAGEQPFRIVHSDPLELNNTKHKEVSISLFHSHLNMETKTKNQ